MLKIYQILSAIGVMIWFGSLTAYFVFPLHQGMLTYILEIGVMIYGLAHVAGMKHYKDLYDKVNQ